MHNIDRTNLESTYGEYAGEYPGEYVAWILAFQQILSDSIIELWRIVCHQERVCHRQQVQKLLCERRLRQ